VSKVRPDEMRDVLSDILRVSGRGARIVRACAVYGEHSQYTEFYLDRRALSRGERALIRETFGNSLETHLGDHVIVIVSGLCSNPDEVYHHAIGEVNMRADRSWALLADRNDPSETVVIPATPVAVYGARPTESQFDPVVYSHYRKPRSLGCVGWALIFAAVCALIAGLFPVR